MPELDWFCWVEYKNLQCQTILIPTCNNTSECDNSNTKCSTNILCYYSNALIYRLWLMAVEEHFLCRLLYFAAFALAAIHFVAVIMCCTNEREFMEVFDRLHHSHNNLSLLAINTNWIVFVCENICICLDDFLSTWILYIIFIHDDTLYISLAWFSSSAVLAFFSRFYT